MAAGPVTAFAPASIGNVAVGFDMLGLAVSGLGDRVTARRTDGDGVAIAAVHGRDGAVHPELSTAVDENTAGVGAARLWREHGRGGLELTLFKGTPLKSGTGSSAASAVAGVVATNALLARPLATAALLKYALAGERIASGGEHADNIGPSLLGGLVLCPPALLPDARRLEVPAGVSSVLVHPDVEISTAESRRALSPTLPRDQWLAQQGYLAAFITACRQGDSDWLGRSLRDVVIEPQRKAQVPGFDAVQAAALAAGAFGCSLSGSGPSLFALCRDADTAAVAAAMTAAFRAAGQASEAWISPMDSPGARLEAGE